MVDRGLATGPIYANYWQVILPAFDDPTLLKRYMLGTIDCDAIYCHVLSPYRSKRNIRLLSRLTKRPMTYVLHASGLIFCYAKYSCRAVALSSARKSNTLVSKLPCVLLLSSGPARRNAQVVPARRRRKNSAGEKIASAFLAGTPFPRLAFA